jgi:uncharacterized protein
MAGSGGIGSGSAGTAGQPPSGPPSAAACSDRGASSARPYRGPLWLPGAHAQTIWPSVMTPRPAVSYRTERWPTADGDTVRLDWVDASTPVTGGISRRPLLVLFHGLEGSSDSHYARWLMAHTRDLGIDGVVIHFRGCGGEPLCGPRAYHSGDSDEADWVLRRLAAERAAAGTTSVMLAVGVSLGGNVLAKWLGERGTEAGFIAAAAVISPPQDLHAGAVALSRGFNRFYAWSFLRTLRTKSLAMLDRHPGLFDRTRVAECRDFFDFDELVTAPLHGFASALDYWQRSSCRPFLAGITVPTLVVNALNDPFLPASALARAQDVSRAVRLDYPEQGGHVGFPGGAPPGRLDWLPHRVFDFFAEVLGTDALATR